MIVYNEKKRLGCSGVWTRVYLVIDRDGDHWARLVRNILFFINNWISRSTSYEYDLHTENEGVVVVSNDYQGSLFVIMNHGGR